MNTHHVKAFAGTAVLIASIAAAGGCATAVYDSLDRRGVSAGELTVARAGEAVGAASRARAALERTRDALTAIDGAEGIELSRRIASADGARAAAGQQSVLLRRSADNLRETGRRWTDDLASQLQYADGAARSRAESDLAAARTQYRRLDEAFGDAEQAAGAALTAAARETGFLKDQPNAAAASSRTEERRKASAALDTAIAALRKAEKEAAQFSG